MVLGLDPGFPIADQMPVDLFIEFLMSTDQAKAVECEYAAQLAWEFGRAIDKKLMQLYMTDVYAFESENVQVTPADVLEFGMSDESDNRKLVAYSETGIQQAAEFWDTSGSVDKVRVFGIGLFDNFACLPDNTGYWGIPLDHQVFTLANILLSGFLLEA